MKGRPVRVLRVISRLNVGGPAIQAITLTRELASRGYETLLVRGTEAPREGNMDDLAARLAVQPLKIDGLRRELGPHDAFALRRLVAIMRQARADVLHTHAAKAGTLGRLAAVLAGRAAPPVRVHTFHGHVLTGYFSPARAELFRRIERELARSTSRLIAISDEVRDDLVRLDVAPAEKIEVIRLGFALGDFEMGNAESARERVRVRGELGISPDEVVATLVARLVPIKRVDRFLAVARRLVDAPQLRFVVVGDGELAEELRASPAAAELGDRLVWAGMRSDIPAVMAASDVVCLSSDNEGTAASLIEAHAAGKPVVSTAVGGVASVVLDGRSGSLVPPDRDDLFAERVRALVADPGLRRGFGRAGREHVVGSFSLARLADDVDGLYRRLHRERS